MSATLSQAVIEASNAARDTYLKTIDPAAFAAPPKPTGGAPSSSSMPAPPPPMMTPVKKVLAPGYYGNSFFQMISDLLIKQAKVLATTTTQDNLDYAGWFNYFFAEAKKSAKPEAVGRIFSVLFDLPEALEKVGLKLALAPGFKFPAQLSTGFHRLLALAPAGIPLGVLTYLLEEGFETFPPVSAKSGIVHTGEGTVDDPKVSHQFGAYFDLQSATNTQPVARDTTSDYLIFYRGDSRAPSMVVAHGGARCRADLAFWRKAAHVDEPWHPWKNATESGKMWIRKGNADNDYFTVNSIAMDFHISCAYPMLRIGEIDKSLTGHVTDWTDQERARLRASRKADFCLVRNRRTGQDEIALCDTSRVYLCVFKEDSQLSPTYTHNTYAEMGVRDVDLTQIIAWFEIDRYHNNDALRRGQPNAARSTACYESTTEGSTMTIHVRDWGWMNGAKGGKNTLGLENPSTFEQRLNGYKGTTFEINHSRLVSRTSTTFDPATRRKAANVWGTVAPPKLKV